MGQLGCGAVAAAVIYGDQIKNYSLCQPLAKERLYRSHSMDATIVERKQSPHPHTIPWPGGRGCHLLGTSLALMVTRSLLSVHALMRLV